jgi:hypothetical protein
MSELEIAQAALAYEPSAVEVLQWNAAVSGAVEVEGYSLYGGKANDRTLDALVGVPLVITRVTFRHGDICPDKGPIYDGKTGKDYVSAECLVHPAHAHKFARRFVVFNDSSTGIYRQIVAALSSQGLITLNEELPEEGGMNATRYDVSFSGCRITPDGEEYWTSPTYGFHISCPEGLRRSDYAVPGKGDGCTWYLA